jgi:hypothetical protein
MSLRAKEIASSCCAATDMARSHAFHEGMIGLHPAKLVGEPGGMQWTENGIGAGTFSLGVASGWNPTSDGSCMALEVEGLDAAIAEPKAADLAFKMDPFPAPVCQMASIFGPDKNVVRIHKRHAGHN